MELRKPGKKKKLETKTGPYVAWAEQTLDKIGTDIKCAGKRWFMYIEDEGYYMEVDKDRFAPIARDVQEQPKPNITEAILRDIQHISQCLVDDFRSAICWEDGQEKAVLVNARNCVIRVDLETGERKQLEHHLKYRFLSRLEANYVEGATCSWFIKTLEECLPEKADRDVVLAFGSYIFCPDCRLEQALICIGEGACGKSTIAYHGFGNVLGKTAMSNLSLSEICNSTHVHQIMGRSLNIGTELKAVELLESDNFKRGVSGESITGNPKFIPQFSFVPTTKFCFLTNTSPRFKDGSSAESRRCAFVFFPNQFTENKDNLRKKLIEQERDGILLLMLDGLPAVMTIQELPKGSEDSRAVQEEFATRNDFVAAFVNKHCDRGDTTVFELRSSIHLRVQRFADEVGYTINDVHFARAFRQKFPREGRWTSRHGRKRDDKGIQKYYYVGIKLKSEFSFTHGKNGQTDKEILDNVL